MQTKKWTPELTGNLNGKTVIITGASSGIGLETAKTVAGKGAEVIIAVRNPEKGKLAADAINSAFPGSKTEVILLDLADLKSVKKFADEIKRRFSKLDLLVNNAGVMIPPFSKTRDGFELQFGTNHLGHFVLTAELFDLLRSVQGSRIVNVSSMAHQYGNIDFDDLNWEKREYKAWRAYGDSKIANIYFTNELARRIEKAGAGVITVACHPGWTATELQRNSRLFRLLNNFFAQKPEMGAMPTLRAALDQGVKPAEFYGPDGFKQMKGYPVLSDTNKLAKDKIKAERLWKVSEEMTGIVFNI